MKADKAFGVLYLFITNDNVSETMANLDNSKKSISSDFLVFLKK